MFAPTNVAFQLLGPGVAASLSLGSQSTSLPSFPKSLVVYLGSVLRTAGRIDTPVVDLRTRSENTNFLTQAQISKCRHCWQMRLQFLPRSSRSCSTTFAMATRSARICCRVRTCLGGWTCFNLGLGVRNSTLALIVLRSYQLLRLVLSQFHCQGLLGNCNSTIRNQGAFVLALNQRYLSVKTCLTRSLNLSATEGRTPHRERSYAFHSEPGQHAVKFFSAHWDSGGHVWFAIAEIMGFWCWIITE